MTVTLTRNRANAREIHNSYSRYQIFSFFVSKSFRKLFLLSVHRRLFHVKPRPAEYYMLKELAPGALTGVHGVVQYQPAFGI